jgi:hypothetical protein
MSAKRYSGNATLTVTWEGEKQSAYKNCPPGTEPFRVTISQGSKCATVLICARLVHGSGVGVDSPKMIDEVAQSALSFADDDGKIDGDLLDMNDVGFIVRRAR